MKKTIPIILSIVFCMTCISACAAQTEDLTITLQIDNPVMTVNGEEKPIDEQGTAPVVINGRTLLPVRAVIEEIGGKVEWDSETQTVILARGKDIVVLGIDNTTAYHNEESHTLDVAPTIINYRTMIPIRFIAESFNFDVAWDNETQTVTITKAADSL